MWRRSKLVVLEKTFRLVLLSRLLSSRRLSRLLRLTFLLLGLRSLTLSRPLSTLHGTLESARRVLLTLFFTYRIRYRFTFDA